MSKEKVLFVGTKLMYYTLFTNPSILCIQVVKSKSANDYYILKRLLVITY